MAAIVSRSVRLSEQQTQQAQHVAKRIHSASVDGGRHTFSYNGLSYPVTDDKCNDILVLCDAPSWEAAKWGYPMHPDNMRMFTQAAEKAGVRPEEITFMGICTPVPSVDIKSAARTWKHVEQYVEGVQAYVKQHKPKLVVTLGALASRVMFDRAVSITKARGVAVKPSPDKPLLFPMLSPGFVLRVPEHKKLFDGDIATLGKIKEAGYNADNLVTTETDYQWCYDLQFMLDNPPTALAVDTEGTGLRWHQDGVRCLTVQLSPQPGVSYIVPVDADYVTRWSSYFPARLRGRLPRLVSQLKQILENPDIIKMGHNIKFDHMMIRKMGINMQNVKHDTQMMAFGVDENMMSKTLDDCVRVWVPEMSGYADDFNTHVNKNDMFNVPPEDILDENGRVITYGMRKYAGGDTDATFRLARALYPILRQEPTQWNVYERIHMPALMAFANRLERYGMVVDQEALRKLSHDVKEWLRNEYRALIRMVPAPVRLKHLEKGLKFSRDEFVRDVLFSPEGFGLKPQVFTKSTEDLPDDQKVPSVSTKDHMPYFVTNKGPAGNFVTRLIEYQKTQKMDSTYCGNEQERTGFWQYLSPDGRIFPSFALHKTNTGRCILATSVVTTNFGPMTMAEIGEQWRARGKAANIFVVTHDERLRPVEDFVDNGVRPVFKLTTASGASVTATANHPIWTDRGWVNLEDLAVGDKVFTGSYDQERPTEEEWRPYRDTGYEVSSLGRVRLPGRPCVTPMKKGSWGHVKVKIRPDAHSKPRDHAVHRMVCEVFNGQPLPGQECRHLNGLPADNRPDNLVWGTRLENAQDGTRQGRYKRNGSHRLTDQQADELVARFRAGEFYKDLADEYGVHWTYVHMLARGDRRQHAKRHTLSEIVAIEPMGEQQTFDISVKDDHSFVAGNVVVHNTASSDPNGQNYPKRGQWAKQFLKVFRPNPGYRFVAADLSQIELRIAAWESQDPTMLRIYREDGDIHMMTAAATMRLSVEEFLQQEAAVRKFKRFCAKAVNFGFVYGMGWNGFRTYAKTQYGVDYTNREAQETRELFFDTYRLLPEWHRRRKAEARRNGFVSSLHGAIRHLPSIRSSDEGVAAMAERQAVNAPVQRFGSDLGVMALTRLSWQADPEIMRPVGFVHDQVICEAKIGHELEAVNALVWAMENPPLEEWFGITAPLPIKAEPDIGDSLGTTLELNELPKAEDGSAKLPEWWAETGIEPVLVDGTWKAPFTPAKPTWWRDDEKAAEQQFMRYLHV